MAQNFEKSFFIQHIENIFKEKIEEIIKHFNF